MQLLKKTQSRSISELYDKCKYEDWCYLCQFPDYIPLIKTGIELYVKECLDLQRKNLFKYACNIALKSDVDERQQNEIHRLLTSNCINIQDFCVKFRKFMECSEIKINGFRIYGAPNSGKSLIANCIVKPFICCFMNNHGSENEFFLSNMLNKAIILCEELYITIATAEDMKSVLGGQPIDIAKKFNEKQMLSRTPCVITSNWPRFGRGHIPQTDEEALTLRCFNFVFNCQFVPACKIEWQQFYLFVLNNVM